MSSVYILGRDITDKSIYILLNGASFRQYEFENIFWRLGILRTPSLTGHPYILGLYCLLILTIYIYVAQKVRISVVALLFSGIFFSVSRIAYGGLIVVLAIEMMKRKKWLLLPLLFPIAFALAWVNLGDDFNLSTIFESHLPESGEITIAHDIRKYSRHKAIEVWKDNFLWGVGPGMFGGKVSFLYNSPSYEKYNFNLIPYLMESRSIEQFWFQILAETGIVGTLCFISFIVMFFFVLHIARKRAANDKTKNLFAGLRAFIPCILIYSLGSGINIAPVLFTYCAFVGISLGNLNNHAAVKTSAMHLKERST